MYMDLPVTKTITEIIISTAGNPKAKEKQFESPKQCTSSLKIGVRLVEIKDPALMAK